MYQEFFKLNNLPFSLTPNPHFFCQLKGHQDALNTLQFCIDSGEGFIKIVGEVGSGKTLLCRKLLESLDSTFISAYIPNPDLSPIELRKAFARELGLDPSRAEDNHELLTLINHHLIKLHAEDKKVVLVIDEAQALTDESLETIRLLTNLETEKEKLLQVVLFGQPELNDRLNQSHLRQLKQRITFSYQLPLLNREEVDIYLSHRLAMAGYTHGNLFTKRAKKILYRASQGVPRMINVLCHKALLAAYGFGEHEINHKIMKLAVNDTEISLSRKYSLFSLFLITLGLSFVLILIGYLV